MINDASALYRLSPFFTLAAIPPPSIYRSRYPCPFQGDSTGLPSTLRASMVR
ncbi:hypothetical protein DAQ1742_04206 [Dickeya aquatica]|uniref:Uncharacterized protein n=1 Tax=Dickeya aquatica TaxID=1401087 RepID=A0A375AFU7_9GAMM|nr:hypothetical protein DAQ1742_04206 [Dickeya aquatica]